MSIRHSRYWTPSIFGFWLHIWTEFGDWVVGIENDRNGDTYELWRQK